ncbi:MAG: MFS transporter [Methanobacteriota archaeon]
MATETAGFPSAAERAHPAGFGAIVNTTVIVAALGYFVDIYDLILFSIVRVSSLSAIGVAEADLLPVGVLLLNMQMGGMLVGGILWGILGDKRGRLSVLFGSIALYSVATFANAFVTDVPTYAALRFVAGVGLAGELGAAITLVSEVMPKETRGYSTTIVAGVGILGAMGAGLVGRLFDWKVAYIVGGVLGLLLLIARISVSESGMFRSVARSEVRRGDLFLLVGSPRRAGKYLACILIGLPIWFAIGVFITFSPEIGRELGTSAPIVAGSAVMAEYLGAAVGSLCWGILSQRYRTRWWVLFAAIVMGFVLFFAIFVARGIDPVTFYLLAFVMGISGGYWAVFVTVAAEQFGTNLRSTVATTVPNFIRGSVVPITFSFLYLGGRVGLLRSALIVGTVCTLIALVALRYLDETYGKDLDYVET